MERLTNAYWLHQWEEFGELFAGLYLKASEGRQLSLLRDLLTKYRDERAYQAVIAKLGAELL